MNARRLILVAADLLVLLASCAAAFLLRFDGSPSPHYRNLLLSSLPLYVAGQLSAFLWLNLYSGLWRYASLTDLVKISQAWVAGSIGASALVLMTHHADYPRTVLGIASILTFLGIVGVRFSIRILRSFQAARGLPKATRSVLIMGAGDLGESLARQMLESRHPRYRILGFIDDNPSKWNLQIHGIPVLGGRGVLKITLEKHRIDEILIAFGVRRTEAGRRMMETLRREAAPAEVRIAPSLEEMLRAPASEALLAQVKPADLLNRKPVSLDEPRLPQSIAGKTVLVTGAGGTIGSELCRQILRHRPRKLIALENHATSLFYQERRLAQNGNAARVVCILGDVRDRGLLDRLFLEHQPQIVLHAAAHKHVSQLESNAHEALSNNVLATYYAAQAADRHGAECFLLISTDKAVRPSSVMGAAKRLAEITVQSFARSSKTRFTAVRFGNVLGSSGSVLPIFQEQIAHGGPVTVTDPEATRYCMTVEESVQLILHAAAIARGGEIFVLKMGTPVKILDMAKKLISLTGLEPGEDIRIEFTGLRPGEKMHEELMENPRDAVTSGHPDILMFKPPALGLPALRRRMSNLEFLLREQDGAAALRHLSDSVPGFTRKTAPPAGRLSAVPVG